jgi:hypothetical protein
MANFHGAIAFNTDATRLYYRDVSLFSSAGICRFELDSSGDPIGSPVCDCNPPRDIDNDILILTFP